jgi:vanillate O-demethylase ferredoxin subunit
MSKKTTLSMIVKINKKVDEADGIVRLELVDPHGRELPAFTAGSHIDVQVAPDTIRQYSLSNAPWDNSRYQLGVLRESKSRGGSTAVHDTLNEGDYLHISAPRNHFELRPAAKKSLLLAGGIGITPIYAMAQQLDRDGQPFEFHYSARSRANMAFADELEDASFSDQCHFYLSDEPDTGRLDMAALAKDVEPDTHLYVCGPERFTDHALKTFKDSGWPVDHLHTEYFVAEDIDTSDDGSFKVRIASTGEEFDIPADETIADVLIDNDIDLLTSCEQGICGTCVTKVLEGTPDHRDRYLDDDEHAANNVMTPCCSRSKSSLLVLDL